MNPIRWYETQNPAWYVTSPYGYRTGAYAGFHNGVDLGGGGGCNAPIRTPFGGKVLLATNVGMGTAGKSVIIEIAPNILQYHFHLNDYRCKVGDVVSSGDVIGTNGGTNNTNKPYSCHIHYELRNKDGKIPWGCSVWGDPEKFTLFQEPNSNVFNIGDVVVNIANSSLNVRSVPNITGRVVNSIGVNEKVKVLPHKDNGIRIGNHNWWFVDKGGWSSEQFLKKVEIQKPAPIPPAPIPPAPVNAKTIILSAGHGGKDPGAVAFGLHEADRVLKIALACRDYLNKNYDGHNIVMIREGNTTVGLIERRGITIKSKADLYVSMHMNAFTASSAHGFESFIFSGSVHPNTVRNQQVIHDEVFGYLRTLGMIDRGKKRSNHWVVTHIPSSVVLLEYLFLTNVKESEIAKNDANLVNMGMHTAIGIANALGLPKKGK